MESEPTKKPVVFLAGKQIYLRPIELSDVPSMQRWINDPETRRTLNNVRPFNEVAERKYVEEVIGSSNASVTLAIVLRDNDRHIGSIGLHEIETTDCRATLGILIGEPDCRGKGYGTQAVELMLAHAFEALNLHRVQLDVFDFNGAGIRAYEKAGFVREGVLRDARFTEGRYHDVYRYGILAREYFARHARGDEQ